MPWRTQSRLFDENLDPTEILMETGRETLVQGELYAKLRIQGLSRARLNPVSVKYTARHVRKSDNF